MDSYTVTVHVTIHPYRPLSKRTLAMRVESIRIASVRLWPWRHTYGAAIWHALIRNDSERAPQPLQRHASIFTASVASQQPNIVENVEWLQCSNAHPAQKTRQKRRQCGTNARYGTAWASTACVSHPIHWMSPEHSGRGCSHEKNYVCWREERKSNEKKKKK